MKKTALIIFSYATIVFALCIAVSAMAGHLPLLLDGHKTGFVMCRGLLYFFRLLPAVLCSSFLVALAVEFGHDAEKAQMRFSPVIMRHFRHVMIASIILVAILTLTAEIFKPMVQKRKEYLQEEPHLLAEYIRLGKECVKEENWVLAHRYGTQILKIKPSSIEGRDMVDKSEAVLKAIKKINPVTTVKAASEMEPFKEAQNETVTSLINKSKAAGEYGRWFESHYYAQLACIKGNDKDINVIDARRLASIAWNHLLDAPALEKTKDQVLFAKKRAAYKALSEGDNVDAYYQFLEIAAEDITWSSDPDVTQFLEIARKRVENQCFFIEETEKLQTFEAYMNVYFTIKHPAGVTDVVYIRGITPVSDGGRMIQYLRGVTVTTFGKNGSFLKSVKVPYAKMLSVDVSSFDEETMESLDMKKEFKRVPYLMLESIERNHRGKRIYPEYEFAGYIRNQKKDNFLILPLSMDDFNTACDSSVGIEKMNLNSLMKVSGKSAGLGYSPEVSGDIMIKRVTYPILMMMILIVLATMAWSYRIGEEQLFKFVWIVIIPVFSVLCDILIQIVLTVSGLLNFLLISELGNSALLAALLICIGLLVIAAFSFALRKSN